MTLVQISIAGFYVMVVLEMSLKMTNWCFYLYLLRDVLYLGQDIGRGRAWPFLWLLTYFRRKHGVITYGFQPCFDQALPIS